MKKYCFLLLVVHVTLSVGEVFYEKLRQSPQENYKCLILEKSTLRKFKGFETSDVNELKMMIKPAVSASSETMLKIQDNSKLIEIYAKNQHVLETYIDTLCKTKETIPPLSLRRRLGTREGPEIEKIVDGGDQANRIDVVFMGDVYTADERDKFFDDMRRLTTDMFIGETFRSYLPVFNIWAIYVESVDSGIGYTGAKDTPFRLYREAGQLRGIYTGNAAFARQICQLTGTNGCDYPSIIGSDDYYGGLGGEFVISTKSNRTGTVVLRHEMGHNFVNVGEEYDNGQVYSGVNSAPNLKVVATKWGHWLSDENARVERAIYRLLEYPWADLSNGERSFTFTSDGSYFRWLLAASVSAAGEEDSLEFVLDGEILPWETRGSDDREFCNWSGDQGFTAGEHTFPVRSKTNSTNPDIPRMICSIALHEFGNEDEFHIDNDYISAYPTFDVFRRITYRPTNAGCLMRNMTHNQFCPVCREGMWYQFLRRISLIDEVVVSKAVNLDRTKQVTVNTLKLGQLRVPGNEVDGEKLEVRWTHRAVGKCVMGSRSGRYVRNVYFKIDNRNTVRFVTSEVRNDPTGLLQDTEQFTVTLPVNATIPAVG